ncbi:P-type ATPase [Trypanosoma melophagium]|uniref:P-type ATPase n=1 Tax=Trypanosoma melophagium TaxID=715481 RepID=UPI00351AA338|nr:P-type ATPase [Trypanosoma melophagium]
MGIAGKLLSLCRPSRKKEGDDERTIRPGFPTNEYCDNKMKSYKYTIFTFLPMNLFEQFHRPINLYFLLVTALQFVPSLSPVSPFTTLVPLTIAFLITAIKEGVDDWRRHRLDNICNSRRYNVIDMKRLTIEDVKCSDIQVGDVLLLLPMQVVPCDVVLLLSSGDNGEVTISTEALDGETVCKKRYAVLSDMYAQRPTASVLTADSTQDDESDIRAAAEFIRDASCVIESEGPKPFLNSFTGAVRARMPHGNEAEEEEVLLGISAENVALNTSVVKNTRFTLGVAILTGNETRVAMTRAAPPTKWSIIDQSFNRMVLVVFILQFILVVVFVALSDTQLRKDQWKLWYLGTNDNITLSEYTVVLPLRFFLLVSPMVPLSFKVMVDASKSYMSRLIMWDKDMSDENGDAEVHNSSLTEDLGRVEYVLTDKTGTLTRNAMTLNCLVTANDKIFAPDVPHEASYLKSALKEDDILLHLMRTLVYCNTVESVVQVTTSVAQPSSLGAVPTSAWVSPSPDEVALVEGAAHLGVKLLERTRKRAFVAFGEKVESATILQVLSFTPERRRMSVLLQVDGDSKYLLVTKGSDESVLPICVTSSYSGFSSLNMISRLSREGLRILVGAYRYLSEEEVQTWLSEIRKAGAVISADVRALNVNQSYERIEKDLIYCGITAVEDQLQEKLCHTITQMRLAGMRVWMLTGDKSQTAKQTAIASGLVGPDERIVALTPDDMQSMSEREHLEYAKDRINYALRRKQFEEAEKEHLMLSSAYVRSGLSDIIDEFVKHNSASSLMAQSKYRKVEEEQRDYYYYYQQKQQQEQQQKHQQVYDDILRGEREAMLSSTTSNECKGYVISFSGKTLELLKGNDNEKLFSDFKKVLLHASTVICSRMTPDQKSFVVRVVKKAGHVTLAVGDGGNDVSMIQCAHVGVGIKGREGGQAAAASDIVLSRFSFLSKLLLFHGHTAFQRSAIIVQQSFWKTVTLAWMQLLFNIYTEFSGVSFWDSFALTMYNSFFTAPVTFLCAMNMPLSSSILLGNPKLYALSQRGRYFNSITFYGYIFRGFLHGTVIFFLSMGFLIDASGGIMQSGHPVDRSCDFYVSCFALVTLHSSIILLEAHSITLLHWSALVWSVAALFLLFTVYSLLAATPSFRELLRDGRFYLQWLLGVAVPLVTLAMYAAVKFFFFPDLLQLQRLVLHRAAGPHERQRLVHLPLPPDDAPSQFLASLSPARLCAGNPRHGRLTAVSILASSVDLQSMHSGERRSCASGEGKATSASGRDSVVLSEPFLKL